MRLEDLDYDLPGELIAQRPAPELALFQQGYLRLWVQAHDFGCGFGAGGDATDDDDFQGHKNWDRLGYCGLRLPAVCFVPPLPELSVELPAERDR